MGRTVYLIITDLHLGNLVTATRRNYRNEVAVVEAQLIKIAARYKQQGYNVVALMLGDIFHNSYKDVTEALTDKDFIGLWRLKVGEIYTVMGNHEFTYYKANPFYSTLSRIEAESVSRILNKVWTPLGMSNTIRVVDRLEDGDVVFHFNHYGIDVLEPEAGKTNIGLFHQDLVDYQIVHQIREENNRNFFGKATELEQNGTLRGYQYCFFGHIHTIYGVWKAGDVYLHYLASLGRTNEGEVRDDFLERNVPGVIVEDGKFVEVEDNFIQLATREETIQEELVRRNHKKYEEQKEVRMLRHYAPLGDDPMENLREIFREEPGVLQIMEELRSADEDQRFLSLRRRMRGMGIE